MTVVLVVLVLAVVVAIVAGVVYAMRSSAGRASGTAEAPSTRIRPELAEFHVRGDGAHVRFAVPLPDGAVDEHLRTLLEHEAVAVLREKRDRGLPLDDVTHVVVYGRRDGEAVQVGRVDLPSAGVLPEVAAPELIPHGHVAGFDPLHALTETELDVVPGLQVREGEGQLPPVSAAIEIPSSLQAGLRAQGIDPGRAGLPDLVVGLLQASGYVLTPHRGRLAAADDAVVHRAARAGSASLVAVVEHRAGDHPELSEALINEMIILAQQANLGGFLVTDKYGPYVMYEKERRSKVRFITRERLQAFVDSFVLGG